MRKHLYRLCTFFLIRLCRAPWMRDAFYQSRKESVSFKWWGAPSIHFRDLGIRLRKGEHYALVSGYEYAQALQQSCGASFWVDGESLRARVNGIGFLVRRPVELYIMNEVFALGEYGFTSEEDYIVIDIGMNVGIASLYFASQGHVKAVYGFEPIPKLYQEALGMFRHNPDLSKMIHPRNVGLGCGREKPTFYYNDLWSGNTTAYVDKPQANNAQGIDAQVEDAQTVINEIAAAHPNDNICIKMDTEGMEFDIMESFAGMMPQNVRLWMLEWHFQQPDSIVRKLKGNGFTVIVNHRQKELGMIYAYR